MKVEVRVEYACGHPPRIINSGDCRPETLGEDLRLMVAGPNEVNFNCHCGRGAAFVDIIVNGKTISRSPASAFLGMPGARLTLLDR